MRAWAWIAAAASKGLRRPLDAGSVEVTGAVMRGGVVSIPPGWVHDLEGIELAPSGRPSWRRRAERILVAPWLIPSARSSPLSCVPRPRAR